MDHLRSIPIASPYPWSDSVEIGKDADENECDSKINHFSSERIVRGGFWYIQSQLLKKDSNLSDSTKRILLRYLRELKVELLPFRSGTANEGLTPSPVTTVLDNTMVEETVLHLAVNGQISLFGSILAVIDEHPDSSVSSKHIIRECALTVNPSRTPGLLDAREMVLAALHFLSQSFHDDNFLVSLPLIRPISITGDLERRSYEKVSQWTLPNIIEGVAALEDHFYGCEIDFTWLSRGKFVPQTMNSAPVEFLLRGILPEYLQKQKVYVDSKSKTDSKNKPKSKTNVIARKKSVQSTSVKSVRKSSSELSESQMNKAILERTDANRTDAETRTESYTKDHGYSTSADEDSSKNDSVNDDNEDIEEYFQD